MAKKVDATSGNLIKKIFVYTIPVILSTILQNFFTIADRAVLGNMAGSVAVASIGATGVITSLIIDGAFGLSTGTVIVLARFVGQKDEEKIRKTIDTSLLTAVLFGVVVAIVGWLTVPSFLKVTHCPEECFDGALIYTRIYLTSAPIILLYNYGAAIMRTLGDTKRPLYFIVVGGVVNVTLNVILCLLLPQKVAAVAVATLVARTISIVLVLRRLSHFDGVSWFNLRRIKFDFGIFVKILRFGVPASISLLVVPFGNLQIVPSINSYGVDAIAGNSAAISLQSIASAFTGGFATAATTFIGQNLGAQNRERVKKSFWYILGLSALISGALGAFLFLSGRFWMGLIVGASEKAAIDYGMQRAFFVVLFTFVSAISMVLSRSLQAFGYPLFTSISNIVFTLFFRIFWMQVIYPHNPKFFMLMLCFLVSWTLNLLASTVIHTVVYLRYTRKGICRKI